MNPVENSELFEKKIDFYTDCGQCVFAQFDVNEHVRDQTGCKLGRLNRFKSKGLAELQVDDCNSAYHIKTHCNTARPQEWADNNPGKNLEELVRTEVATKIDAIIDGVNATVRDIAWTFNSLMAQTLRPNSIVIATKENGQEIFNHFQEMKPDIPFFVTESYEEFPLDAAVKSCKGTHYYLAEAKAWIASDTLNKIDHAINTHLIKLIMVNPPPSNAPSGLVLHCKVHNLMGGFKGIIDIGDYRNLHNMVEKVTALAEIQGKQDMIKTWEEIWNLE